jgi:hypothetical protein
MMPGPVRKKLISRKSECACTVRAAQFHFATVIDGEIERMLSVEIVTPRTEQRHPEGYSTAPEFDGKIPLQRKSEEAAVREQQVLALSRKRQRGCPVPLRSNHTDLPYASLVDHVGKIGERGRIGQFPVQSSALFRHHTGREFHCEGSGLRGFETQQYAQRRIAAPRLRNGVREHGHDLTLLRREASGDRGVFDSRKRRCAPNMTGR